MILKLSKRVNREVFTFISIGVINTAIHWLVLSTLVEEFNFNLVLANGSAFMLANIFSYLANSIYTFKAQITFSGYLKFFTTSLIALGLTLIISYFTQQLGLHYFYGFLLIIFIVPLINFLILKYFVYC